MTDARPDSPLGEPASGPGRTPTRRPEVSPGTTLPPETVDEVLRRFRDRSVAPPPPAGPRAAPVEPAFVAAPTPSPGPEDDPQWTVGPDADPEPSWPFQKVDPGHDVNHERPPRPRMGMARRVGIVIALGVALTGASALTHIGPFHTAPRAAAAAPTAPVAPAAATPTDIRGVWTTINAYADVPYVTTMHITTEDLSTGVFSGTIPSPFGLEIIKGTVAGTAVSFTIDLGSGSEKGTAVLSTTMNKTRIQGSFSNAGGGHGMIVATRTST